jgi:phosphate transport system substrate-binding protein
MKTLWKWGKPLILAALLLGMGVGGWHAAQAALTGRITVKGSDTMLPIGQIWAEAFMKKNPGVTVAVTGGGSGTGISALINGTCDLANSSRLIQEKEINSAKARNFVPKQHNMALDGIAIIVHPNNPVRSLTMDQLKAIFGGPTSNWNQVGGQNVRIVAACRQSSSGTYVFFQENVLKNTKYRQDAQFLPSTNAICQVVSKSTGAVGYVGIGYAQKWAGKVKIVPIAARQGANPVTPSEQTVRNHTYPIWRYLYCYTRGNPTGVTKAYLDFCLSAEGQRLVARTGYIPLR